MMKSFILLSLWCSHGFDFVKLRLNKLQLLIEQLKHIVSSVALDLNTTAVWRAVHWFQWAGRNDWMHCIRRPWILAILNYGHIIAILPSWMYWFCPLSMSPLPIYFHDYSIHGYSTFLVSFLVGGGGLALAYQSMLVISSVVPLAASKLCNTASLLLFKCILMLVQKNIRRLPIATTLLQLQRRNVRQLSNSHNCTVLLIIYIFGSIFFRYFGWQLMPKISVILKYVQMMLIHISGTDGR